MNTVDRKAVTVKHPRGLVIAKSPHGVFRCLSCGWGFDSISEARDHYGRWHAKEKPVQVKLYPPA